MSHNYSGIPRDEESAQQAESSAPKPSWTQRVKDTFHNKFGGNSDERTPLIDSNRMTIEPPKHKTVKIVLSVLFFVLFAVLLGGMVAFWLRGSGSSVSFNDARDVIINTPSNDSIRDYLYHYTSEAHLAGTPSDKAQAEWTRDKLIEFGISDTKIETYWPLLNYPKYRRVAIVSGPEKFRYEAKLREDHIDEDKTSKGQDDVPTFHGYSAAGNVTGPIVYVNYGRLSDFQELAAAGVDFTGTIALVRYGGVFRGLKVKAAQDFGCVGTLIYSDPIDDGPLNKDETSNPADSYPEGPWRSPSSVQRGSVQFLSLLAGDPLTPGYAAKENVTRLPINETISIPKIPSLPISWEDALPLLKALDGHGPKSKADWRGGLTEVGYYVGPSEAEVNLVNDIENKITPIWNVIGKIEGTEEKDRAIILGNHRDAWVFGAVDPSSGSSAMLELARTFGVLLKKGWRPRRSIIFASWDAEEYGLVGSTEWVEDHAEWLSKEGVVYINVDTAVSGPHFSAAASPSLNQLVYDIAGQVTDPKTNNTIYEEWSHSTFVGGEDMAMAEASKPQIGVLGSGSDFVGFLDYLGISSVNLAFGGDYGVYHSNYDSFHWMEKFGDPDFNYHRALVQIWGLMALHLADDIVLPLSPADYAVEIQGYVKALNKYGFPLTFDKLESAASVLQQISTDFEARVNKLRVKVNDKLESKGSLSSKMEKRVKKMNDRLAKFERGLLDPQGIKGRTWFKHTVYAPGLWTGYSGQTFPSIAEAIDAGDLSLIEETETRAAKYVNEAGRWLEGTYDEVRD